MEPPTIHGIYSRNFATSPLGGFSTTKTPNNISITIPRHPLGVRPSGNAYTASQNVKSSLGPFSSFPDELVINLLEFLDDLSLLMFGATCKATYAFARLDELWKNLFIMSPPSSFTWHGTWRSSLLGLPHKLQAVVSCENVFSDILHRPFVCTHTPLLPYTMNIPDKNNIPRFSNLSATKFLDDWTDKPFIVTEPVTEWPIYRRWSSETLLSRYSDTVFRAEAVDWPLHSYVDYMESNSDESPLYLFDRSFVEKMKITVSKSGEYWPPECFGEDLFSSLGDQRPDSRWLIVGPERSGSTFHKDPNATSAWNAVLQGSKYWIMFPSSHAYPPPPGVFVSEDQSEVTSPLSIAEWLLGFHAKARKTLGCREGICNAGEVLHVPSGWWHLVVNLSPSIAITQNFVPKAHLADVLAFLRDRSDQVSGFKNDIKDPFSLFVEKMETNHGDILKKALPQSLRINVGRKRKWDALVNANEVANTESSEKTTFGFGFGDDDSDVDVP